MKKKIGLGLALGLLVLPSASRADDGFAANLGLNLGYGKMYNSTKSIPVRTMNTIAATALPGYRFGDFVVGPLLELRFVGQNTEPSEVSNQNLKGTGYLFGLGAMYRMDRWKFLGSLDFIGKHSLSNQDSIGRDSTFKKPRGFHLLAGYGVLPAVSVDFVFSYEGYKTNTLGGVDSDISDNKLMHWNAALGASYAFN